MQLQIAKVLLQLQPALLHELRSVGGGALRHDLRSGRAARAVALCARAAPHVFVEIAEDALLRERWQLPALLPFALFLWEGAPQLHTGTETPAPVSCAHPGTARAHRRRKCAGMARTLLWSVRNSE
jgi:hypothetical protein